MDRRKYIGGSDAAAVLGLNPYRTAHQVWLRKTGRVAEEPSNLAMRIGQLAEPMLSTLYEEQTHKALVPAEFVAHREVPFIGGTPDRLVKGEPMSVELKTANIRTADRWGAAGTDEVPEEYLVQVALYLSILDHDSAELAVLLGGSDFRVYRLLRDRELEGEMLERLQKFWRDHVQADRPPAVDGSAGAAEMLTTLHPKPGAALLDATTHHDALADRYLQARRAREAWEAKEEIAKQQLQEAIGDAKGIKSALWSASWAAVKGRASTNWEAVAREAQAAEGLIQKHTTIGAGYRRFMLKAKE